MAVSTSQLAHVYLSLEEYLASEIDSPVKREWVDGAVFTIAGASIRHNVVKDNVSAFGRSLPNADDCRITTSDTKVRTERAVYYPDVVVACGPVGPDPYVEAAPCVIAEVLSPSTAAIDMREKLAAYRALPSLHDYLVIDPEVRHVEWHRRGNSGWEVTSIIGNGAIHLTCLGGDLGLDDVYRGLDTP
jgi:Uma2 family endonuclease